MGSAPKPPACEVSRMCPVEDEACRGGAEGREVAPAGGVSGTDGVVEGIVVLSADIGGPQKTQCTDGVWCLRADGFGTMARNLFSTRL
jgi:hypothetical protein